MLAESSRSVLVSPFEILERRCDCLTISTEACRARGHTSFSFPESMEQESWTSKLSELLGMEEVELTLPSDIPTKILYRDLGRYLNGRDVQLVKGWLSGRSMNEADVDKIIRQARSQHATSILGHFLEAQAKVAYEENLPLLRRLTDPSVIKFRLKSSFLTSVLNSPNQTSTCGLLRRNSYIRLSWMT